MAATATKFPDVGGTAIPRRRPKVKRDLKQWTAIFDAQRTSGLSVESFCRANAISPSVYWKWRKIIGLTRKSSGVKADMPSFLPIPIKAAPSCGLELEFGAMRVRLDGAAMERVLDALVQRISTQA